MSVRLTLEREGQFNVNWTHSHNRQCGNVGTSTLDYRVRIRGSIEDLNPNGWLLDNNQIPAYFVETYASVRDFKSCEEIAHKACGDFADMVRDGGGRPRYISVSVSGIPGSAITCEWSGA